MKKTMVFCDMCGKALAEEYAKELERFIMLDHRKESNVWMGPVVSWAPGILLNDDMYFCEWACYRVWMADWYKEADKLMPTAA